jgi:hypothetical protein
MKSTVDEIRQRFDADVEVLGPGHRPVGHGDAELRCRLDRDCSLDM